MERGGKKHLRIEGILEIAVGVISILAIQFLLQSDADGAAALTDKEAKGALAHLALLYGANGFKILAGLIGICLANKKSVLTVICGGLLFLAQLIGFLQVGDDIVQIVINIVLLVIPYYYLHNAVKNFKG